ncbi:hypothetical protein [Undibacterium sp. TJN19]|uniref:hypothetical protein n=1 Tax=Undibacterium sp. TJN19 TaxID=3413055 RepID=UPI003BF2B2B4
MSTIKHWPFFSQRLNTKTHYLTSKWDVRTASFISYIRITVLLMCGLFSASAMAQDVKFIKSNLVNLYHPNATAAEHAEMPIVMTYPSTFSTEVRQASGQSILFIKSPTTEVDSFFNKDATTVIGDGFFTIGLSLNVGFIPGANKFSGEDEMQADYLKAGFTNVIARRVDQKDFPIGEVTATAPNGHRVYIAYIALGNSRSALRIMYYHPKEYKPFETLIWRKLIDNLVG